MLAELLRSIRSARDVAPLFTALGYQRALRRLDQDEWLVATWRRFDVVARDADDPRGEARSLATRLGQASRRALAVAVGSGELAIAAPRFGHGGSTRVLVIPLAGPQPLALRILESLRPDGAPHALAHALRVAETLSTESVGERFFAAFRQALERMSAGLGRRGSPADRRLAALLPLTRILFLYFVQAKGWLDGRPDYLRRLLDSTLARRRHFHRTGLNPLFFGTLNRRPEQRRATARLGAIPYLNGGLFEPHPIERRLGPIVFPNDLWRDAFDLLFERFRFCVREADEVDAIAPDMLGRVFERVMDDVDRHQTGTFYTPEVVVRQMVDAALETALAASLPAEDLRRLFAGSLGEGPAADRARSALRRLRVLDPAVGSGAFLLGTLARLTQLHRGLEPAAPADACALRRTILRENLFGVDLSPVAVRLAELRLWLAVVADDPTADISRVVPLPNLDGVVRQGDSLLDPIGAARACYAAVPAGADAAGRAIAAARRALFDARGAAGREAAADLQRREGTLAMTLVERARSSAEAALRDLASAARSPDLFGRASGLTAHQRSGYRRLSGHRAWLQRVGAALAHGQVPFFSFEVHAPEVMEAGGFSLVIGNPPWVRCERLSPELRGTLRERFSWWRAGPGTGFLHLPDLSVAFLERSLELAASGGTVAMLMPSKVASASYAETARRSLVAETQLAYVHRVSDREAARFGAATYPLALIVSKGAPRPEHRVRLGFDAGETVPQRALAAPGPWILIPDAPRQALEALRAAGRPLREVASPILGE
ncbi:MAG: N-6 DNA methylase [Gemmatimonadetes bacterium]|nr:N-6 DNA methylase [Gemmatimonadota bacterium]